MIKIDKSTVMASGNSLELLRDLLGLRMAIEADDDLRALYTFALMNLMQFKMENPHCDFSEAETQEKLSAFVLDNIEKVKIPGDEDDDESEGEYHELS